MNLNKILLFSNEYNENFKKMNSSRKNWFEGKFF